MPMAKALKAVAPKAKAINRALPSTFNQWTRAMSMIPSGRLEALTDPVVNLLGAVAGLTSQQMVAGGLRAARRVGGHGNEKRLSQVKGPPPWTQFVMEYGMAGESIRSGVRYQRACRVSAQAASSWYLQTIIPRQRLCCAICVVERQGAD